MLLTITTTHQPATDLGYLLHKHPARAQAMRLGFGSVNVFYPVAGKETCTAAVLLDVDPIGLIRGGARGKSHFSLDQYVNDRPYVCSSFMSVALGQLFRTALNGQCKKRPELVDTLMPLHCHISMLPCRGGERFLRELFEPLGYTVQAKGYGLDSQFTEWGSSSYYTVELSQTTTVKQLLNHLYVLIPVLDNRKHYYVNEGEVEKLLKRGEGWLSGHPAKEIIAQRYLRRRKSYMRQLLERLTEDDEEDRLEDEPRLSPEETVETQLNLNQVRLGDVLAQLKASGAESVIDLGCGEGKLLALLLKEKSFKKICGADVSSKVLEIAVSRLRLEDMPPKRRERIELLHGSLMYKDERFKGFDAAAVVEVIEHLDPPRLSAFEQVVFGCARPKTVIVTTPNREYNKMWPQLPAGSLRHGDHRFEWTRQEFQQWTAAIRERFRYEADILPVGKEEPGTGPPTQMAVFTRENQ
jgi:3' terminal RNA ribose 2'-O-methyltransferase Hen1